MIVQEFSFQHYLFIDTSGDPELDRLRPVYYTGVDLIMLCFAVNSLGSFLSLGDRWIPEIQVFTPNTPVVILGLKSDFRQDSTETIELQEIVNLLQRIPNSLGYKELSCLLETGLDEVISVLDNVDTNVLKNLDLLSCISSKESSSDKSYKSYKEDEFQTLFDSMDSSPQNLSGINSCTTPSTYIDESSFRVWNEIPFDAQNSQDSHENAQENSPKLIPKYSPKLIEKDTRQSRHESLLVQKQKQKRNSDQVYTKPTSKKKWNLFKNPFKSKEKSSKRTTLPPNFALSNSHFHQQESFFDQEYISHSSNAYIHTKQSSNFIRESTLQKPKKRKSFWFF